MMFEVGGGGGLTRDGGLFERGGGGGGGGGGSLERGAYLRGGAYLIQQRRWYQFSIKN